jgi:hypothetical protein
MRRWSSTLHCPTTYSLPGEIRYTRDARGGHNRLQKTQLRTPAASIVANNLQSEQGSPRFWLVAVGTQLSLDPDEINRVTRSKLKPMIKHVLEGVSWQAAALVYLYTHVCASRPRLWSSGQSSWLQIQRSGFDSRRYQIFWEVVGLERDPLSLVSTIEELLERKSSGLENRDYGSTHPPHWLWDNLLSAQSWH